MLRVYFGTLAAALGVTGFAAAQPAVPISTKTVRPAFVPTKTAQPAQPVQQVNAEPAPVPAAPPPVAVAPAPMAQPVTLPSGCAADVATACGESPAAGACDCLCGPPGRVWLGAEYLLWTTKGNNLPPLATAAPAGTARGVAGTIGGPGTTTLIGGRNYNTDWRSGFRVYGGAWLDQGQRFGVSGDYFFLGNSTTREVAGSDGSQIVTRPFTNNVVRNADGTFTPVAAFPDTELVSFPNVLAGQIAVTTQSEFTGAGVNGIVNLACSPCGRLDFLIGYRYLNLNDTLYIREDLRGLPGSANAGAAFVVEDRFRTENHFNGVNLGLAWERRFDRFFVNVLGSVALGNTHTIVDIDGATTITDAAGNSQKSAGGLLAQPSNIGRYSLNKFAVVPEVGVKLGAQLTDHLRVYVGYNFIYWSNVVRTGDVIDTRVNASQLPPRTNVTGELFPKFEPRYTDFWAHGVSFGVQFRY
jgi:hypothetical protein